MVIYARKHWPNMNILFCIYPGALDCVLSTWGSWSECPIQECGGGMQRRYRSVVVHPKKGGSFCPHMSEAKMCPKLPCNGKKLSM